MKQFFSHHMISNYASVICDQQHMRKRTARGHPCWDGGKQHEDINTFEKEGGKPVNYRVVFTQHQTIIDNVSHSPLKLVTKFKTSQNQAKKSEKLNSILSFRGLVTEVATSIEKGMEL